MSTTNSSTGAGARAHSLVPSPVGLLTVVAAAGAIVGIYHEHHQPRPQAQVLGRPIGTPGGGFDGSRDTADRPGVASRDSNDLDVLAEAAHQLDQYFDGLSTGFDLPTDLTGTPFQLRVWRALAEIPYGQRSSYREIATHLGNPSMGRAIGAAIRVNPLSIVVPGHRVVSSTGAVIGYAAGIEAKEALLTLESRYRSVSPAHAAVGAHPPAGPGFGMR